MTGDPPILRKLCESAREDGRSMTKRGYPVYRISPIGNEAVRVGSILEFRRSRRSMNRIGLAKLAQKLFALAPGDTIIVGTDSSLERAQLSGENTITLSAG
jgi:hypothetical protein